MSRHAAPSLVTLSVTLCLAASSALAQAPLLEGFGGPAGYGEELDVVADSFAGPLDLTPIFPQGFDFFGELYFDFYVNENGNVSFGRHWSAFSPKQFPLSASPPIIAPFWSDVDLCQPVFAVCAEPPFIDNAVYWHVDEETGRVIVTWHEVGYELAEKDKDNSFQVVLRSLPQISARSFDIEFRYEQIEWTAPEAYPQPDPDSDGGTIINYIHAQAGFDSRDDFNYLSLPGSFTPAIIDLMTTSNVGEPGVWRFQNHDGLLTECGNNLLEPGEQCEDGNVARDDGCSPDCREEVDSDGDGEADPYDNCPGVSNAGQEDSDGDAVGDVCDNCAAIPNRFQADYDGDDLGDACDDEDGGFAAPDGGSALDAGGARGDGGGSNVDGGVLPDAGNLPIDSGAPGGDGGGAVVSGDAGTGVVLDEGDGGEAGVTEGCGCAQAAGARASGEANATAPGAMAALLACAALLLPRRRRDGSRADRARS